MSSDRVVDILLATHNGSRYLPQLLETLVAQTDNRWHLVARDDASEDETAARLEGFRPISQSIVKLATQVRGAKAETSYSHMFCPMVKGGSGDWLQANGELRNPYYGSQMLTFGKLVSTFPLVGHLPGEPEHEHDQQPQTPLESQKD